MQDSLKARCWYNGKMHYDDFVVTSTGYVAKVQTHLDALGKFIIDQTDLEFDKKAVAMRCTGLKDKNKKLIYENDILLSPDMDEPYRIIVEWDNEKGYIIKAWNGKEFEYALSDDEIEDLKSFEIIGNSYENPELLEVENEFLH